MEVIKMAKKLNVKKFSDLSAEEKKIQKELDKMEKLKKQLDELERARAEEERKRELKKQELKSEMIQEVFEEMSYEQVLNFVQALSYDDLFSEIFEKVVGGERTKLEKKKEVKDPE
jgi:hypothetical protein